MRKPVTPKKLDKDLQELPVKEPWKPGDPIRVVPDLRETDRPPPEEDKPAPEK